MKDLVYGYARISTPSQNIERQIRNIGKEYPEAVIVKEAYSGTVSNRPEWSKLRTQAKKAAEKGQSVTIVFDSVSRMSRNAVDGCETYFELFDSGVNLVFLKERHINTSVFRETIRQSIPETGNEIADVYIQATNRVIQILARKQIEKAFEQSAKEVEDLHQRTREGMETARLNGKQIGRYEGQKVIYQKQKDMSERIRKMSKSFDGNMTDKECIEILGLARGTYYKYKAAMKAAI